MIDFTKFTRKELETMLETREKLLSDMSFQPNLPEVLEEIEDLKNYLGIKESKYGEA